MMHAEEPTLAEGMRLVWVIDCYRCKTEQAVEIPDDLGKAIARLTELGWTAEKVANFNKDRLAGIMDTTAWPDTKTHIQCPACNGETRRA